MIAHVRGGFGNRPDDRVAVAQVEVAFAEWDGGRAEVANQLLPKLSARSNDGDLHGDRAAATERLVIMMMMKLKRRQLVG